MKRALSAFVLIVALALGLFTVGGLGDQLSYWRWARGGPSPWPTHERSDLTALVLPGHLLLHGRVALADVGEPTVGLLLNRDLDVRWARVDGRPIEVTHGLRLGTRYHREGRLVLLHLPSVPVDGRVTVELLASGEAAHGDQGSDWMGILYVGDSEVRLSEQTNWHPQVPLDADGPAKARVPYILAVLAPEAWEIFATGQPLDGSPAALGPGDTLMEAFPPALLADSVGERADQPLRVWRFVANRPAEPNLVGGLRQRASVRVGDTRVLTLLRDEHAALGPAFVELSAEGLSLLGQYFGPSAAGNLCVFEQSCRSDSSYNWAGEGLVVFDRHALGDEVPVAKLAHELGHLWWGQGWASVGPGERFLTEGGAEASGWVMLDQLALTERLNRALGLARRRVTALVEDGESAALDTVGFGSDAYSTLAYSKGGLVHRYVWGSLGSEGRAAFFAELGDDAAPLTLERWRAALARVDPTLRVPWIDQAGDARVRLLQVDYDEAARTVSVQVAAEAHPASPGFDAALRVGLAVSGRGFEHTAALDLAPGVTTHVIDLSGVRPWSPADRDPAELFGAHGEPVVHAIALDPEGLLPGGVQGDSSVVLEGPRLVASAPAQGARAPFGLTTLSLTFDRPVQAFDAEGFRATLPPPVSGAEVPDVQSVSWSADGRTATLTIGPLAPGRGWALPLRGAVRGGWGDPPVDAALVFETAASDDDEPPRVIAVEPAVGATGVDPGLTEIVVTFDEVMQRGVGFDSPSVRALQADGFAWPEMDFGRWDASRRVLTLPITAPLEPGATYKLPIGRPLRDLSGNVAARDTIEFSTADG